MTTVIATSTEMQNNFGRYAAIVKNGGEVIVTSNGRVFGRFVPKKAEQVSVAKELRGILRETPDLETAKDEYMRQKYETAD